jgi:O-antigen/teichoic acid export membrane protein
MLRHRAIKGVLWNFAQTLSQRGIGMLVTLLLARFLAPADFGLMAMLAVFLAVATSLMDSGFREALIQKSEVTDTDYATALWANVALGAVAYLALFVCAPLVAGFYAEPRLVALLRVAGLIVPCTSVQVTTIAALSRQLDFRAQLMATVPASLISGGVAVALAYAGAGAWALVVQMLLAAVITSVLLLWKRHWLRNRVFDRRSFGQMFRFGRNMFAAGLLEIVFSNAYVVVIAKLFSASIAGYFFFAQRIRDLVLNQLVASIQTVTYPAFVSIGADDARMKQGYRKLVRITTFVLFPTVLILAALAEPLFEALLPATWWPAALYLQLSCLAGVLYPLHAVNLNVLKVKGRSDVFLGIEIVKKAMLVAVLAVSLRFGIMGVLWGQVAVSVVSYGPNSYFTKRFIGYSLWEQLGDVLPALLLALAAAAAALAAGSLVQGPAIMKTGAGAALALALYLGGALLFRFESLALIRTLITERMRARPAYDPAHR